MKIMFDILVGSFFVYFAMVGPTVFVMMIDNWSEYNRKQKMFLFLTGGPLAVIGFMVGVVVKILFKGWGRFFQRLGNIPQSEKQ